MRFFLSLLILLFFITAIPVFAQDQCAILLSEAEDQYEQGKLYEVSGLIKSCIDEGFTKEEKVRAYRLLTLTYLFLNYQDKADSAYLELLRLSPEYVTNDELDPMEIINQHDKFTTRPIYYLTMAKIGINYSFANILLDYSISQSGNNSNKYASILGFQVGVGAEMVVYQNLHLSGEVFFSRKSLHLTDTHWDFYKTDMDIIHNELELPIMLKYNFFRGKVNPFVSAGVSPAFLVESTMQNIQGAYRITGTDGEPDEEFPVQPRPEIGTTKMKNRINYSILLGAGINYKIGLNYLVFEARYSKGMLNVTDVDNRWREDEDLPEGRALKFPTGYVDDDFKFNNLSFLIGFVRPLYKPRKIK